jgi:WD40 repeat protein
MARIFISYKHVEPDESVARFVSNHLLNLDHEVFFDRDSLAIGDLWDPRIGHELESSRWFVPLVSLSYVNSRYVLERELPLAFSLRDASRLEILPINLAFNGELPDQARRLRDFHWFEWREPGDSLRVAEQLAAIIPLPQTLLKGMRPFTETDATLFAGLERGAMVASFRNLVDTASTQFVTVYGVSGAGKTSFIRAGVIPSLPPGSSTVVELQYGREQGLEALRTPPRYVCFDQFDHTLIGLSRTPGLPAAFESEMIAWSESHPSTRVVFCVRDEYRTAFEAMLPSIAGKSKGFPLFPFEPAVAGRVLQRLLANAQIEHDPEFLHPLCDELAEGVPRSVTPAILQLLAQYAKNHKLTLNKGTWDQLSHDQRSFFAEHLKDAIVSRLPRRVTALNASLVLKALTSGDVKSSAKTVEDIGQEADLDVSLVGDVLDLALRPDARVVTLEKGKNEDVQRFKLVHDLFAPAIHAIAREHQQRRAVRRRTALAAGLIGLVLVLSGALITAAWQRRDALFQQLVAESYRITQERDLATDTGLLLALEAFQRRPAPTALEAVTRSITKLLPLERQIAAQGLKELALTGDGRLIVIREAVRDPRGGHFEVFEIASGRRISQFSSEGPTKFASSESTDHIAWASSSWEGRGWATQVHLRHAASDRDLHHLSIEGYPQQMAFDRNVQRLIVGTDVKRCLFDVATGHLIQGCATTDVNRVAFSPDGVWLAVSECDPGGLPGHPTPCYLSLALANGGALVHRIRSADAVQDLAWVDQPTKLVRGLSHSFEIMDPQTNKLIRSVETVGRLRSLMSTGSAVVFRDDRGIVSYDVNTQIVHVIPIAGDYLELAMSSDGRLVAVMLAGAPVRLFDIQSGTEAARLPCTGYTEAVAFSADGQFFATSCAALTEDRAYSNSDIAIFHNRLNRLTDIGFDIHQLQPGPSSVLAVFGKDAAQGLDEAGDHSLSTSKLLPGVRAISHDGQLMLVQEKDGAVVVGGKDRQGTLRPLDGRPFADLLTPLGVDNAVSGARFSSDGRWVGTFAYVPEVWDVATGARVLGLSSDPSTYPEKDVAFSSDSSFVAIAEGGQRGHQNANVKFFDLPRRPFFSEQNIFDGFFGPLAFSPDGRLLAAATSDGSVAILDLQKRPSVTWRTLPFSRAVISAMAFAPDSQHLAIGYGNGYPDKSRVSDWLVRIWNVATIDERFRLPQDSAIEALRFRSEGRFLDVAGGRIVNSYLWKQDDLLKEGCRYLVGARWDPALVRRLFMPWERPYALCRD